MAKAKRPRSNRLADHSSATARQHLLSRLAKDMRGRLVSANRRRARGGDFQSWVKYYLPHHASRPFSRLHLYMMSTLEAMAKKRGQQEGVVAPRGNSKTTIAANAYPIYATCEGLERYGILASETISQSIKFLNVLRTELTENWRIKQDYPHVFGEGSKWNEGEVVTRNGVRWEAAGVRKSVRGTKHGEQRPTFVLGDDLDDLECRHSSTRRQKNWEWVTDTLLPIGDETTNFWFSGTAIHPECTVMRLPKEAGINCPVFASVVKWPDDMSIWAEWENILKDPSEWDPKKRRATADAFYEKNKERMNAGAEVLWSEWEPLYSLMLQRARMGHRGFSSEKQGDPADPSMCDWGQDPFKHDGIWFSDWPSPADTLCRTSALDPSKGKSDKTGDWQAIAHLVVRVDGTLFYDIEMTRVPIREMCIRFVQGIAAHRPDIAVVEDAAFQDLLITVLEDVAAEIGLIVPIQGLSHGNVPKTTRVRRLGPWIERGRIKFRRNSPGCAIAMAQLAQHPTSDYDDGPDAMEMCLRQAQILLAGGDEDNDDNPY